MAWIYNPALDVKSEVLDESVVAWQLSGWQLTDAPPPPPIVLDEVPEAGTPLAVPADVPVEEAPVDVPVEEPAPVEEAPVVDAPVDEVPVDQAPVDEAPVEEAPVEEAPVEEAPVDVSPDVTPAPDLSA